MPPRKIIMLDLEAPEVETLLLVATRNAAVDSGAFEDQDLMEAFTDEVVGVCLRTLGSLALRSHDRWTELSEAVAEWVYLMPNTDPPPDREIATQIQLVGAANVLDAIALTARKAGLAGRYNQSVDLVRYFHGCCEHRRHNP